MGFNLRPIGICCEGVLGESPSIRLEDSRSVITTRFDFLEEVYLLAHC